MKLNKIHIENFLSIKDQEINFEDFKSITHIIGRNFDTSPVTSNGAGKSSIIEAVIFALFGKTLRKTNEKSITNYYTSGLCKVTLTVNDNVIIERTKKPPRLAIEVAGKNYTQDSIIETQKFLEKTLNTNYSVFTASMVFGQANTMNFVTATPDEKRAVIQSFLSVGDLSQNRAAIRSLKSRALSDKKVSEALMNAAQKEVTEFASKLKQIDKDKKVSANLLSKGAQKFIKQHSLSDIKDLEEREAALIARLNEVSYIQSSLDEKISFYTKRHQEAKGCDRCGNIPYAQGTGILDTIDELTNDKKEREKESASLKIKIDAISIPISSHDFETVERYKEILRDEEFYVDKIKLKKSEVVLHGEGILENQRRYDIMKFWEVAFSESGLIKYIIRNILDFFNSRSNYYLTSLSKGKFIIEFDDSLNETIFNEGESSFFDSMSGGEKKRVSLAVMLALNDLLLLTGKERSNLIFFDEVADTLDGQGVVSLFEVLNNISKEKKILVITHNDEFISLLQNEADNFYVEKRKKITTFSR